MRYHGEMRVGNGFRAVGRTTGKFKDLFLRNENIPAALRHICNTIDTLVFFVPTCILSYLTVLEFIGGAKNFVMLLIDLVVLAGLVTLFLINADTIERNNQWAIKRDKNRPVVDSPLRRFIETEAIPRFLKVLITLVVVGALDAGLCHAAQACSGVTVLISGYNVSVVSIAALVAAFILMMTAGVVISKIILGIDPYDESDYWEEQRRAASDGEGENSGEN